MYLAYHTKVSFLETVKDFFSISASNKHSIVMEFLKLLLSRNNSEKYSKITLTWRKIVAPVALFENEQTR